MSGRNAFAALLPRLVLIASALLGVGLTYATGHFCAVPHTRSDASASAGAGDHPGMTHRPGMASLSGTANLPAMASLPGLAGVSGMAAAHEAAVGFDSSPVVVCLAALAAVMVVVVLTLLGLGRREPVGGPERRRPTALPAVRGSPPPYALALRRVAVLRT